MSVATTGQAMQKGIGWRMALRAALADNPNVKGERLSPKTGARCWGCRNAPLRHETNPA